MKKSMLVLALILAAFISLVAQEAAPAVESPVKFKMDLGIVAATTLEAKATLTEHLIIPVLVGDGLFAGNNLELKLAEELSPASANLGFEAVLTPVAFLQFNAGAMIGTGWDFFGIGNGFGYNTPANDGTHNSLITRENLATLMYKFKAGGVFQFDLAALIPGDWNHIVARTYHEFWYRGVAGVPDSQFWLFENGPGEEKNGWNYYANYLIGYQMPIFLQTVAMLLETEKYLYNTPGGSTWGEDQMRLNFGPILNFQLSEQFSVALIVQFKTIKNFSAATAAYGWYQDRVVDAANPQKLVWNRLALSVNIKF
jgi:hypothetical protein